MEQNKELNQDKQCDIHVVSYSGVCPDYDDDCKDMSIEKATWCYTGCQGHKCNPDPNSSLGTAKGYCPLLHHCN